MQGFGLADGGHADEAGLAVASHLLQRRHHVVQHLIGAEVSLAGIEGQRIVQLQKVHMVLLQAGQALLDRTADGAGNVTLLVGCQAHLGAQNDVRPQGFEDVPKVGLRGAVAIKRGGVEKVDTKLKRQLHGPALIGRIALRHQPAHGAAAEGEQRYLKTGSSQNSLFHVLLAHAIGMVTRPRFTGYHRANGITTVPAPNRQQKGPS